MPIYEYRCKKGHSFELMQPINDDALTKCQVCGAPCERVLFAPAVHFKGSGFYNTDYGTKKRSREMQASAKAGADKTDAKAAEKKDGAKGDSGGGGDSSGGGGNSGSGGDPKPAKAAEKPASAKSGD